MRGLPSFSVVIASIGRPGLSNILYDITRTDLDSPIEVILVLDGVDPHDVNLGAWEEMCSKVILTPKRVGPSVAYSLGINQVETDYFRIFTDDDAWDGTAFKRIVRLVRENTVLVCRTRVQDEFGSKIRDSYFPKSLSPLESVYAPILPWKRNKVYFHLTSMVFPLNASRIPFNESLVIREDLDWLQRIHQSNISFDFSKEIIGTVYPSHARSQKRQTVQLDLEWVDRLQLISKDLPKNFAYFHCFRSFAANGVPSEIFARIVPLIKVAGYPRLSQAFAIMFYVTISFVRKIQLKLARQ
jgi:hypothetical protein